MKKAIMVINELKESGLIEDYAIFHARFRCLCNIGKRISE